MKYAILTGSSGGMGLATAEQLVLNGYHVFALDIKEPSEKLENLTFIETDLRNISDIERAFNKVKEITNEVDTIISMAGIYDLNSLIEMSEEDFIKIFDINVFAVYRLNKLFVPLLKENGKVIMISSELAPLDPLPFTGIYAITKSTVEKYAYSLRMELQLLNKQVVVIRPGAVDTSMIEASTKRIENFENNTQVYKYNANRFKHITEKVENRKISAKILGILVLKILKKNKPKYVYRINRNPFLLLLNLLPKKLQNWIIKRILNSRK